LWVGGLMLSHLRIINEFRTKGDGLQKWQIPSILQAKNSMNGSENRHSVCQIFILMRKYAH
jgi:hypothetical protein